MSLWFRASSCFSLVVALGEGRAVAGGTMAEEEEEAKQPVQLLQELVDQLYSFRDHYFETHPVEYAGQKHQDVREEMEKTLSKMEEAGGFSQEKAFVLMLTGKALNVTPDYSPQAEELLSKAVKLDPELVEAWNQLGEVYWKKGDVAAAHTCFSGALSHYRNKVSLQNLSMVLRQLRAETGEEHSRHVMDSVRQAKLAVQMDVHDGRSWYILGNAYLSLFFNAGQNPKISQQALSAYAQAEKVDRTASSNPDLHLNRATGKVKAKKLQSMLGNLRPAQLGPCGDGRYQAASGQKMTLELKALNTLQPGINSGTVVLGKVLFSLTTEEKVPFTFGLVDSEGPCFAVTVYNMVQSWGVLIGDSVAIPEPHLRHHQIQHKGKNYSFSCIRVETPLLLVVNGKPQGSSSQAASTVAYRPQSE
ncbi:tetratricopeptide repeat protein 5 isoform X2 [Petaurus breviceps papuanus]|uniref:tetratricopeptide repeat protein 5 isoform X2 n=1 Tax=Petaurus breviceps papuanus TaxID=3040969 RepID=UPI0036DEBD9C